MEIILFDEIVIFFCVTIAGGLLCNATGLSPGNKEHDRHQMPWHDNNSALWYKNTNFKLLKKTNNNVY